MKTIKELVNGDATFLYYRAGHLYYQTACGYKFSVPLDDIGEATFNNTEKGILMMRYIRKQLDLEQKSKV